MQHNSRAKRGEPGRFYRGVVLNYDGDECLPWPYGRFGSGRPQLLNKQVHRLVCIEVHGLPPTPEHQAAHSCGNGHLGCVARRHLSWKTPLENAKDREMHGRTAKGEKNGSAKLKEDDVRVIRALRGRVTGREIAQMFNIAPSAVCAIQLRQKWAWL